MGSPLSHSEIETPLGMMTALADEQALYLLEFSDWHGLGAMAQKLQAKTQRQIVVGTTPILECLRQELEAYFTGSLHTFQTPICPLGTPFQLLAWEALRKVLYGETQSYRDQALAVGNPLGFRAVARANATNPLTILIPCHRIINHNGQLGGYGGGLDRKVWLLSHEKHHKKL